MAGLATLRSHFFLSFCEDDEEEEGLIESEYISGAAFLERELRTGYDEIEEEEEEGEGEEEGIETEFFVGIDLLPFLFLTLKLLLLELLETEAWI